MPDDRCIDDLRRWSSHARERGFADSAKLLSTAAARIEDGEPDAALAADVLAYRDAVESKKRTSFGAMLTRTGEALAPKEKGEA